MGGWGGGGIGAAAGPDGFANGARCQIVKNS